MHKILAIVLYPWVFFALRGKWGKALLTGFLFYLGFIFVVLLMMSVLASSSSEENLPSLPTYFAYFAYYMTIVFVILGIKRTRAYKSVEALPKGIFIAICLPFLTLLKYRRFVLGVLSLANTVILFVIYTLYLISTSDLHHYSTGALIWHLVLFTAETFHVLPDLLNTNNTDAIDAIRGLSACISWIAQFVALMKCVGMDLARQEAQAMPTIPDVVSLQSVQHPDILILMGLDHARKITFLEHKTPLEIASIQTGLGNLPLEQRIFIEKAIKESIQQVLRGEQHAR
ncbi:MULTISPECIES: hypothetical protein [Helicobacter]|nr:MULTISPECIES: hypothetical protein [Helicobacter]BDQ28130.1 hypothetical protein ASB1_18060 [Helicobacter heilmannii]GLH58552.1 hypothetical protein NHP214376_13430 [Helicobacter ailurogastricus]GLH60020.1 hypothetical protein NHP214377_12920 [Helicobacter ailurogastricus]CRF45873.1 hypothetical protein HHE014_08520 [Helicobacter heilmannii]